jgi:hypothetical protein
MAGKSIKNKSKRNAVARKSISKTRAAKLGNAGKKGSRKVGRRAPKK